MSNEIASWNNVNVIVKDPQEFECIFHEGFQRRRDHEWQSVTFSSYLIDSSSSLNLTQIDRVKIDLKSPSKHINYYLDPASVVCLAMVFRPTSFCFKGGEVQSEFPSWAHLPVSSDEILYQSGPVVVAFLKNPLSRRYLFPVSDLPVVSIEIGRQDHTKDILRPIGVFWLETMTGFPLWSNPDILFFWFDDIWCWGLDSQSTDSATPFKLMW